MARRFGTAIRALKDDLRKRQGSIDALVVGVYAHEGLVPMAAAPLSHIVSNHPFAEGHERAGLLAAHAFLDVNRVTLAHHSEAFHKLTTGVAEGRIGEAAVAAELERIARSMPV